MAETWRPDLAKGVFETLLVLDGRPVELEAHMARLEASLAELYPDHKFPSLADVPSVGGHYGDSTSGTSGDGLHGDMALRITVAPNESGELVVRTNQRPAPCVALVPDNDTKATQPSLASLRLSGGLGAHKWVDRSLLDATQAELPTGALPLIADSDGAMLEASRANVFAVRRGALYTPPLDGRILPGITRRRVLELAAGLNLEAHETELHREDLLHADEVFLTGSVRGIELVGSIDGESTAARGEIAATLAAQLRRLWLGAPVA